MSKYGKEWDLYFLEIAKAVAKNSKCLSRKIGSVLVKDKSIVSTGYNGPARGIPTCDSRVTRVTHSDKVSTVRIGGVDYEDKVWKSDTCPRKLIGAPSGQRLDLCIAGHSERNAIIQAAREGISPKGAELYCYCGLPCKDCMTEIVNVGIDTVICLDRSLDYDYWSEYIVSHSNINVVRYSKDAV